MNREYTGGLDSDGHCVYRSPDNSDRRCIMGRALYGRVDESSPFWETCSSMSVILNPGMNKWHFPDVKAAVPWMSHFLAGAIQSVHDDIFGTRSSDKLRNVRSESFWSNLIERAQKADAAYKDKH